MIHLPLDRTDRRKTGRTQKVEHQEGISFRHAEISTALRPSAGIGDSHRAHNIFLRHKTCDGCHRRLPVPQPSGIKIHAIALPAAASRDWSISSSASIRNPSEVNPKYVINQMTMVESRMIVPAFLMKDHPHSHMGAAHCLPSAYGKPEAP